MTRNLTISGILAVALHATVLFGTHRVTPPRPLPVTQESLEVELTTALEEPAPLPEIPTSPEPDPPVPATPPEPEPVPEPPPSEPQVTAPEPPPEPMPEPVKKPAPVERSAAPPKLKPPAPKQRPKTLPSVSKPVTPSSGGLPNGTATVKSAGPTTGVRVRSNPPPAYPAAARSSRQEGIVTLDVEVSATGIPTTVSLANGSGFPVLDQAAIAAVRRWRFEPAKVAGTPVVGRVRVPVRFRLER